MWRGRADKIRGERQKWCPESEVRKKNTELSLLGSFRIPADETACAPLWRSSALQPVYNYSRLMKSMLLI